MTCRAQTYLRELAALYRQHGLDELNREKVAEELELLSVLPGWNRLSTGRLDNDSPERVTFLRMIVRLASIKQDLSPRAAASIQKTDGRIRVVAADPLPVTPADIARGFLAASRAQADGPRSSVCAELAVLSISMRDSPDECSPYCGTVEGARAAWAFIVEKLGSWPIDESSRRAKKNADLLLTSLRETYRRELDAMTDA